jgi:hypothetical protein
MASGANKFKFISPGVFVNEIDRSQIPVQPEAIGPVIVGRMAQGPGLRPVKVSSFEEFVRVFGRPDPGAGGGDNWRTGRFDGPTYGAYAAQAWLASAQAPATVVRLVGAQHRDKESGGDAGWTSFGNPAVTNDPATNGSAYGLFLINSSSTNQTGTGSLAAVWYLSTGTSITISGTVATTVGSTVDGGVHGSLTAQSVTGSTAALIQNRGGSKEFIAEVFQNETSYERVCFNFDPDSEKYIRKVFNTNPSQTNTNLVENTSKAYYPYWLGETYDQFLTTQVTNNDAGTVRGIIFGLASASVGEFDDQRRSYQNAETPFFRSQDLGESGSFYLDDKQKLFKMVALDQGEWANRNIKVSIESIRAADYPTIDPYGTFSVTLRHVRDLDNRPEFLERFDNLNLNPNSENYIARRIGNTFTQWSDSERRLRHYGDYANQSAYVRVEMDTDVANGAVDSAALPFGYFGPERFRGFSFGSASNVPHPIGTQTTTGSTLVAGASNIAFNANIRSSVAGLFAYTTSEESTNAEFSGSFLFPAIRTRLSASEGNLTDPTDAYFGIQTTKTRDSLVYDASYADLTRPLSVDFSTFASNTQTEPSFDFSMDNVVSGSSGYFYRSGSRADGTSYTATGTNTYRDLLSAGFDRFTAPMHGGFDGLNITEKEPFRNTLLSDKTELNNYAFNTVKRAVDSVKDPEVVEANLMTIPGITDTVLTEHLITACEERGDALAVIDIPNSYTPREEGTSYLTETSRAPNITTAISGLRTRSINSSYGCCFFPFVQIRDTGTGRLIDAPPSIAALGTFGTSQARTELWFAPAGFVRGGLSNGAAGIPVTGVKMRLTSKNRDDLYAANINPIATFPNEGIVIFGQKTLQVTPSALDRINVRRLMIFVKKEISRIANSVLFDPNVQTTWDRFTAAANPFLADVKARFGLTDFRVILDNTTTTDDLIDRNILYAKIFLKPARAIEFIALDFIITRTGASFDD